MSYEEVLRTGERGLTGLPVMLSAATDDSSLDEHALAHDVEASGFKLDTQARLADGFLVVFVLELLNGRRVTGRGQVMWCHNEESGSWAGIKIVRMSWIDKRRVSRMLDPDQFDWSSLAELTMKAVVAVTVVAAANKLLFHRPHLLALMERLLPQAIALMLMGWALLGLLRRDRS